MNLIKAEVFKYKSIDHSKPVVIQPDVTVLVGKNESGKTAFLESLYKTSNLSGHKFNPLQDYPRKDFFKYRPKHDAKQYAEVATLTYAATEEEVSVINRAVFNGQEVLKLGWAMSRTVNYSNGATVTVSIDNTAALAALRSSLNETEQVKEVFNGAKNLSEILTRIESKTLSTHESLATFFQTWHERKQAMNETWSNPIEHHVYTHYLAPALPKFLYFDDYRLLPGKISLESLKQRRDAKILTDADETVLGLFELAGIEIDELNSDNGYEDSKAKLEAISLSISKEVFDYWKQNNDISVEFDVKADPADQPPFNAGKNLYIRVKNARHGVTVPFDQRSKGFIWFFSFLVWFSSIENRANTEKSLILLLDEPGLNLHALAQNDFLNFIDHLAESRQIIYTTHSPFMVKNDQLNRVRVVEDNSTEGTKVTSELGGSSDESLFPLQAALGYSIAQNLFISKKNILVEGPADLILLTHMSSLLEGKGKAGLTAGTFTPVGGLDKLVTFIALLGATKLEMVVLHDRASTPPQALESLVQQKLIEKKRVIDYSAFRTPVNIETDVEDLFPVNLYLDAFNECYGTELGSSKVTQAALPTHPRIIEQLNIWLKQNSIQLKPSGGFNHYRVAQSLLPKLTTKSMKAADIVPFEKLFLKLNELLA